MATDVSEAIEQFVQERNISEELALQIVENTILAAYKRKFGSSDNAVVRFDDDNRHVAIFAKKQVVDGVYDPVNEIELEDAKNLQSATEEGDEILIELDPHDFGRLSVQSAKQMVHQNSREIRKDSLYSEYKDKEGDIIIGYYQRERGGTIYVDLGKIEGVLPKKFQSPREIYHVNDRIKALIHKVEKTQTGLSVVLSRTHTEFVRAVFEMEVPEVYDKTIEIHKIVREPGYRTKLAVYSTNKDVDPVGACVGPKGARIQAIIRELEGEKVDILKYDTNPEAFIKNALSPAEIKDVFVLDEATHRALAIVTDNQLSLAIGKQGLNVRLANRLVDWNIDVKTEAQFEEMDVSAESRRAMSRLFGDEEEITRLAELPSVDMDVVNRLQEAGIDLIEDFFVADGDGRLDNIEGLTAEHKDSLRTLIAECEVNDEAEVEYEGASEETAAQETVTEEESEEVYECPECGVAITIDMTKCPNCGVELSFEYEED
ncbi:MAG: transcription termination factor NusA [Spirochaetaceae bacterium]|jgi:N utilization substance protein A|nr:transcription termination factor NusA [Spirochaetaceae bacterium]